MKNESTLFLEKAQENIKTAQMSCKQKNWSTAAFNAQQTLELLIKVCGHESGYVKYLEKRLEENKKQNSKGFNHNKKQNSKGLDKLVTPNDFNHSHMPAEAILFDFVRYFKVSLNQLNTTYFTDSLKEQNFMCIDLLSKFSTILTGAKNHNKKFKNDFWKMSLGEKPKSTELINLFNSITLFKQTFDVVQFVEVMDDNTKQIIKLIKYYKQKNPELVSKKMKEFKQYCLGRGISPQFIDDLFLDDNFRFRETLKKLSCQLGNRFEDFFLGPNGFMSVLDMPKYMNAIFPVQQFRMFTQLIYVLSLSLQFFISFHHVILGRYPSTEFGKESSEEIYSKHSNDVLKFVEETELLCKRVCAMLNKSETMF